MKTNMLALVALFAANVALAEAAISVVRVQQRYPWNGNVDVDYSISGVSSAADYRLRLKIDAEVDGEVRSWTATKFVGPHACDLPTGNGDHRLTWDSQADDAKFLSTNVTARLELIYAPCTEKEADIMIVDVSSGPSSSEFPVRYVSGVSPAEFNTMLYKTERIVLRRVPAGTYRVGKSGATVSDDLTWADHWVKLTHDYYLAIFPLTQRQFDLVLGEQWNASEFKGRPDSPIRPVEKIHWTEAQATGGLIWKINSCAKLGSTPVSSFCLPTEAQWEVALRGTDPGEWTYHSENDTTKMPDYAHYKSTETCAVGGHLPSSLGFYDMCGNLHEMCRDRMSHDIPLSTKDNPDEDPCVVGTSGNIVIRGGMFDSTVEWFSNYHRCPTGPTSRINGLGVRLAYECP